MTQDQINIAFLAGLSLFLAIGIVVEVKHRREAFRLAEDAAKRLTETKESLVLLRVSYDEVDGYHKRGMARCKQLLEMNDALTEERNKLQRELTLAASAIAGHASDNELLSNRYKVLSEEHAAVVEHMRRLEEEAKGLRRDAAYRQQKHDEALAELRTRLLDLVQAQCRQRGLLFSEDCARIMDPWHALEWLEFAAKDS